MSAPKPVTHDLSYCPLVDSNLSPGVYLFRPHGTDADPSVAVVAPNGKVLVCDRRWSEMHSTHRYEFRRLVPEQDCVARDHNASQERVHQLLAKVAALRDLVREAYEEGADDCSRDEDNFMRSNAKAALDDLE